MEKEYAEYLLKKTRKDYNQIAADFSRTRDKMWPETRFLFDNYLADRERVLDVGCGNGRMLEFCKDKNIDYIGVDVSEKLIELAKKRYLPSLHSKALKGRKEKFLPSVRFKVADALNLPFPKNYFDKVYSFAVLHHIPSKEFRLQFLNEVKKVLKLDGLFILTVWKFKGKKGLHLIFELYLIIKYIISKIFASSELDYRDMLELWGGKVKRYYHCFSQRELVGLVREAGFKIVRRGTVRNKRGNRNNIYLIAKKSI